jgi:hypothetical protein
MKDLRVACTGAQVGTVIVPPFSLRLGQLVCLHLPHPAPDGFEDALLRVLTGRRPAAGLRLFGRVAAAAPAQDDRIGLFRLLRPLRARRWLRQRSGMSEPEAGAALSRIGLDRDWPLTHLAGNPKTLLGLEAAWAGGAETILFWTNWCDPSGARAVYAAVASRLATCPAIHLSRLRFQDGRPTRDCFPGAACVELRDSSAAPIPAKTA